MSELSWDLINPVKIIANLYFVGTCDYSSSSHIIDTGDGLIMIDSGYPHLMPQVLENIGNLGFKPDDIKILLISHGHYDHMGSSVLLRRQFGTKLYISDEDKPYADGSLNLTWAEELGYSFTLPFEPDEIIHDGDKIELGNTVVNCYSTPGHTPGTMSFVFKTAENGKEYTCATFGGAGLNSMEDGFLKKYNLSDSCREDYLNSLHRMAELNVDVFFGNHPFNSNTREKVEQLKSNPGVNPFIDGKEWKIFLQSCENNFYKKFPDYRQNRATSEE